MTIGLDARFYTEAGGLGRYVSELIKELEKQNTSNFYIIFVNQNGWNQYQPTNPNFKKVLADVKWYTLAEQLKMWWTIKQQKIDLMHFPHWNIPLLYRRPFIVTIHDLILLKYPSRQASTLGWFKYWIKNLGYKIILSHAIKNSQKILVPSQFVKTDILKRLAITENKIQITVEGLTILPNKENKKEALQKFHLTQPYFLYVGVAYPHKNLKTLILAFKKFIENNSTGFQLVLVGRKNYFYQQLENFVKQNNIANVIFTDYLTDEELSQFYQNALAYVFPSLEEGFGLPPLEAMAYQLPVLSSNSSCLPEILGPAALYFNPQSPEEIQIALKQISQDSNLRQKLILAGQNQIKLYSWQNCAQLTLQEYLK